MPLFHKLTFAAFIVLTGTLHAVACPDRASAIAAIEAQDRTTAATLQERVAIDPKCDDAFRLWLDEGVARLTFQAGIEAPTPEQKAQLLTRSLSYFSHWRTYVALADVAIAQGDRSEEARQLQLAINQLNDGPSRHAASDSEIKEIFDRAVVAVSLADEVVSAPRTRSGDMGGIFSTQVRGFVVEELPFPIEYVFDSAEMTPRGESNAQVMLEHLLSANPPAILLEGHTDPKGDDSYNLALSLKRAEAARDFFVEKGFTGKVSVAGLGETMRIMPPPAGVDQDTAEHHQLERRVVLIRE
ncbi:MAG: OmpA family protein [Pseudomonadota bacterium]